MSRRLEIIKPRKITKGWGYELWIHNGEDYCGKVLHFHEGAEFSMHYHVIKDETWYVASGQFLMKSIDPDTAEKYGQVLKVGDVVEVKKGIPHQLYCVEEGDIFEVSTQHFDEDSYRIIVGDSQKK